MQDFWKLSVLRKGHELTLAVYDATRAFPREEAYGLTSQMRRAAVSIPSNIAEGCGRSDGEFERYLSISLGSASELEYQLLLARDLDLLAKQLHQSMEESVQEVKKMLFSLIRKIRERRAEKK